ncbi:hypothetical protein RCOM_1382010 [Ricinus communis]|uniref:F-box domain-containing protein n=1 Tax=Ricinus communis TaxID=3988 RepID=B9S7V7_RICCO|nr:hypothetical protein RCOM_1382010 [Ricinus communis]
MASGEQGSVIDDLPDHIVYNILSFFSLKDIARFSTVSRRCRNLCFSVPRLNINLTDSQLMLTERIKMFDFVDRYMIHRRGTNFQSFALSWSFKKGSVTNLLTEDYRVDSWLRQVARCNVEGLKLSITFQESIESFDLPLCFTDCSSLKYLSINLTNGILKLPATGFRFLQVLILSAAQVQQDLVEEMLSSCKCLKRLIIANLNGLESLNLKSTCLEQLFLGITDTRANTLSTINVSACRLNLLRVFWASRRSSNKKKLVVSAPNIIRLTLEGDIDCDYQLCSFDSLEMASVFVQTNPLLLIKNEASIAAQQRCTEILKHVRHSKVLHLSIAFVKLLSAEIFPAIPLRNVHTLYLHVSPDSEGYNVPLIVSFLMSFPNLRHLTFTSHFESAALINTNQLANSIMEAPSYFMEPLASNRLKPIDKLKDKVLEKMTIYYPPEEYYQLSKIIRSIETFSKAHSTAAVYVLPRVRRLFARHVNFFYTPLI